MSDTNQTPSPDPNQAADPNQRWDPSQPSGPAQSYGSAPSYGSPQPYDPNQPDYPTQSYGSAGSYGSAPEVQGYQQPAYPPAEQSNYVVAQPYGALPEHPQGTTILVLGIVGLFVTICAPIAWYMGSKAQKEIAASGVRYANEQNINIGKIIGMVLTILAIVGIVIAVIFLVIVIVAGVATSGG